MTHRTFYEYIGDADVGYVRGSEYALDVAERTFLSRLTGALLGIPFGWKIVILKPIPLAYCSESDFFECWKLLRTTFSDE